jgi:hypothetical protein
MRTACYAHFSSSCYCNTLSFCLSVVQYPLARTRCPQWGLGWGQLVKVCTAMHVPLHPSRGQVAVEQGKKAPAQQASP